MGLLGGYGLRCAFALSKLGERWGIEALTYNPGVFLHFHGMAKRNAPAFADVVLSHLPNVRSIADVGCGSGAYAAEFKRRGLDVWAGEYAGLGRFIAGRQGLKAHKFDVTQRATLPSRSFDLAYSIEVAEHLPDSLSDNFVDFLVKMSDVLVVTAAVPGQGGHGHVNEQPPEYWIAKFTGRSFEFDRAMSLQIRSDLAARKTASFLSNNLMVFRGNRVTT